MEAPLLSSAFYILPSKTAKELPKYTNWIIKMISVLRFYISLSNNIHHSNDPIHHSQLLNNVVS